MTSEEFKAIRAQLKLTPTELGAIMDMKFHHVTRIEKGERQPTLIQAAFIRYIKKHPPREK